MLQRIPLLRGRWLYLFRLSSLNPRIAFARLLASEPPNFKKDEKPLFNQEVEKEKKFKCICGGKCLCGGACQHVRSNLKYYASAAALLLAGGLVFTRKKRKSSASDEKASKNEGNLGESASAAAASSGSAAAGPSPTVGPFEQSKLPEEIPYLLIGAGTASYYAALTIRARDGDAKILMIGNERHLPYHKPNLTKELWWYGDDNVNDTLEYKALSGRTKEVYYETKGFFVPPEEISAAEHGGVSLLTGHRVVKLDVPAHTAYLDDGRKIKYGKCLIATGLSAYNLPVFENASPELKGKVSLFRTIEDFKKLNDIAKKSKSITIVGSDILATELAYSLNRKFADKGLKINQVFTEKGIVAEILPEFLSKMASDELRKGGVNVLSEQEVAEAVVGEDGQVKLVLSSGDELLTDHVVVSVGVQPNTELALTSDLEVDKLKGGFLVDAELRARTDVWAAGAACSYYDVKLGRRRAELWDDAQVTGRLAGENMTGGQKPYWHQAALYSVIAPGVHFQAIGRTQPDLPTVSVFASADDKPELTDRGVVFYLDGKKIVGIVLYNVFGYSIDVARRVIADGKDHDETDLREMAKLFELHKNESEGEEALSEAEKKEPQPPASAVSAESGDADEVTMNGAKADTKAALKAAAKAAVEVKETQNVIIKANQAEEVVKTENTVETIESEGEKGEEVRNDGEKA